MDLHNADAYSRRAFIARSMVLASAAVTIPRFLDRSALALAAPAGAGTSVPGIPQERILVVVQLGGGNDGLNTVVPFAQPAYYNARPAIAIPEAQVLKLGSREPVGLHPGLRGLQDLHDQGLLSVVQGVGYPNPNRSHFVSMDIWQTADESGVGQGWLGRYFDNECAGRPDCGGVAIGRTAPLAMEGRKVRPVAFETADLFRWTGEDLHEAMAEPYRRLAADAPADGDSSLEFLTRTAMDAQLSSDAIRRAVSATPLVNYPRTGLARQLSMIAAMIRAGLPTRVYYASMSGFDTHAGQGGAQGRHAQLLAEFGDAVKAFYDDLRAQGAHERVLTMSFSEFGRRVGQNASAGTDHGAAAPMFLVGPMVRPGVANPHPSMTELDDGDLKHTVDFRAVYAAALADWMKADARAVLGANARPMRLIQTKG
ncbi:MAG: DUF1501 domain-containing protein [Phycisphaerales bacterium]|nr:DUF1501 domain-containing protein [Phycisphaerales bacterium]